MNFLGEKSRDRPSQYLQGRKRGKKRWRKVVSATLCAALLCSNMAWASADEQFMVAPHLMEDILASGLIEQNEITTNSHLDMRNGITTASYLRLAPNQIITKWEWLGNKDAVDDLNVYLHNDEWYVSLPSNVTKWSLRDPVNVVNLWLPEKIKVTLNDGTETELPVPNYSWRNIPLLTDNTVPDMGFYRLESNALDSYGLAAGVEPLYINLAYGVGAYPDMSQFELFDATTDEGNAAFETALKAHQVTGMTPAGTTVNLFDYVASRDGAVENDISIKDLKVRLPKKSDTELTPVTGPDAWNLGINQGHLLLFGDSMIDAGYWNIGAGAARKWAQDNSNMKGIVEATLKEDGYPTINKEKIDDKINDLDPDSKYDFNSFTPYILWAATSNKNALLNLGDWLQDNYRDAPALSDNVLNNWDQKLSLDYLFDTSELKGEYGAVEEDKRTQGTIKRVYENVTGLFQMDDQGYYYYDARKNFAEFQEKENTTSKDGRNSDGSFILYDGPAVWRTDSGSNGKRSLGNFYPFNEGREVFDCLDTAKNVLSSSINLDSSRWAANEEKGFGLWNTAKEDDVFINHHMGMTMTVDFQQPEDGKLNMGESGKQDMIFEFSGDDDVWVFIDDVLVLDLGGIHSELYGTINFSTGEVVTGQGWRYDGVPKNPGKNPSDNVTSLYKMFEDAFKEKPGEVDKHFVERGDGKKIFPTGSTHSLKLFYLERGNYDSSLCMRFNLQPAIYHNIEKVDQDGDALANVEFKLYPAKLIGKEESTDYRDYEITTKDVNGKDIPIATMKTGKDGVSAFVIEYDDEGEPKTFFSFTDQYYADNTEYYIMREAVSAEGYRRMPEDFVLHFNPKDSMLRVVNRYQTGAYSSFRSHIREAGQLTYGLVDSKGWVSATDIELAETNKRDGLVIAVPMVNQKAMSTNAFGKWVALYGSNKEGYGAVVPQGDGVEEWRKVALKAALYQCSDELWPKWYIACNTDTGKLEGLLQDLPGRSDRYALKGGEDMRMVYGIIEPYALDKLGITGDTPDKRYAALEAYVAHQIEEALPADIDKAENAEELREKIVEDVIEEIYQDLYSATAEGTGYDNSTPKDQAGRGFTFLSTDQFQREFRSIIYIPNEKRELRVWKVDDNGRGINGARFALYNAAKKGDKLVQQDNKPVAAGETATVDGRDGVLILTPNAPENTQGYAKVKWENPTLDNPDSYHCYILKETSPPLGHDLNPVEIPVIVGYYAIYAGAGEVNDGITVMSGVGKLMQTMVKYAADDMVNITLRDITATAQKQSNSINAFGLYEWKDDKLSETSVQRSMNLHYGMNAMVDYGLHDEDGGKNIYPFFTTDEGFLRTQVRQNTDALENAEYECGNNTANYDVLRTQNPDGKTFDYVNLSNLFSQLNIVVVTDNMQRETGTGRLRISKMVSKDKSDEGSEFTEKDYLKNFTFTIELKKETKTEDGKVLIESQPGDYYYYGEQRAGYISDGGTLSLRHDEALTILGLPVGTKWKVSEKPEEEWAIDPNSGVIKGEIAEQDKTYEASFINFKGTPKYGELAVSKIVDGNAENQKKPFNFIVTLSNTSINGTYGDMVFENGVAEFSLKHGEKKTAKGILAGITYTVTEKEANQDGYVTSSVGETGTISEKETAEVVFTNKIEPPKPNTGNLIVSKKVSGKTGDETKEFHFTVTLTPAIKEGVYGDMSFNKEGVAAFTLKHGESIIARDLPVGVEYTVVEQEANQDGYVTTSIAEVNGVIKEDNKITHDNIIVNFVNEKDKTPVVDPETSNLKVTKTVSGNQGDKNKAFNFIVTLDKPIDGEYGEMDFTNGIAAFTLKHGQSKTASGLPADIRYTVAEKEANQDGYTTSHTGETGTIAGGETATAVFNNHKGGSGGGPDPEDPPNNPEEPPNNPKEPKTPVEPKEPKTPPEEPKEPDEPVITEEPKEDKPIIPEVTDNPDEPNSLAEVSEPVAPTDNVPKTGDETRLTFWLILLTISGIGIVVALISRRQQKQRGYRR